MNQNNMKQLLTTLILASLTMTAQAQTAPAFPGAEGHGRYITGGRGGKIVHVTNLNDSGTGSFREAVKDNDKKTVVFDVGGVIALNSAVNIGANTTIAGQTAPAPGITLRYYTVNPNGNNIIMRFIRIRRGQERDVNDGADASTARHFTGMMLDHCSFSWSIDEVASFYDNNNFTMQWCTIGESLNNAGHNKGAHGYGGIWGGKLASFHHNMICHVNNRSPRFNGARYNWSGYTGNKLYSQYQWPNTLQAENVDFRNCVVYNADGCYGGPGGGQVNMVGNYYKSGPAATVTHLTQVTIAASGNAGDDQTYWGLSSRYYLDGNTIDDQAAGWEKFIYDSGTYVSEGDHYIADPNHYYGDVESIEANNSHYIKIRMDKAAPIGEVTTHTAATAFNKVMAFAGASLDRDTVDARYMKEASTGTATYKGSVTGKPGRIDKVSDVEGYTEANFGTGLREAGFDTDKDGMPDAWETANGLDPNNAADAKSYTIDPLKYYTNLEVYLNAIVQDIMLQGNADADSTVTEYYPAYTKADGTHVEAVNYVTPEPTEQADASYELSQTTYLSGTTTMLFDGGISISNQNSKSYQAGKENGIKYSVGVQYTVSLPDDVTISKATFTGYDNYAETDSYLQEVAGQEYESTQFVFPKKNGDNYSVVSVPVSFPAPVTGSFTFTPAGKQIVVAILLEGTKAAAAAISRHEASLPVAIEYYNLQGQRISKPLRGACIVVSHQGDGTSSAKKIFLK